MVTLAGNLSPRNRPFFPENQELRLSRSGVLIHAIEVDQRLRILLEVGEDTTSDDLKRAIPLALEWRDRLLEFQGPNDSGGQAYFYESIIERLEHVEGTTYASVARMINKKIEDHLRGWLVYLEAFEAVRPRLKAFGDYSRWYVEWASTIDISSPATGTDAGLMNARDLVAMTGIPPDEIDWDEALDNLRHGKPAFAREYPVDWQTLKSSVYNCRRRNKHRLLTAKKAREQA